MLSLLNEKKEAGGDPILNLLKRLVRVAINLIINLYPAKDTLIDLLEKLTLVSSKHGYP